MPTAYETAAINYRPSDHPFIIALALFFITGAIIDQLKSAPDSAKATPYDPTFTVESTAVKAYNLTSDGRLFWLINITIRAHNPINRSSYMTFSSMVAKVTKRSRDYHALAKDNLREFGVGVGDDALVHVEAVGLGGVVMERETHEEVRADVAAGVGRVDVILDLKLWRYGRFGAQNYFQVKCKDVVVEFSRVTDRVQKVDCDVRRQ